MIPLSLDAIATAMGGRLADVLDPSVQVTGPCATDSRDVQPGGLFAAVVGAHVDGHDFAQQAIDTGAVAVVAARPVGVPAIVVDDVLTGLAGYARLLLAQVPAATVIGLTGSAGKTSAKDLIAQVLPQLGPTTATNRSFNGELGMPVAVSHISRDTQYVVLEMGARGIGHIANLTKIAPPSVGLVLNVGTAHVGEFGGREAIAQAKGELVEALPADGIAILNADDPLVAAMASRTKARVLTFGLSPEADVRAEDVKLDGSGRPAFTLTVGGVSAPVSLSLHGEHHVSNALGAAAVAYGLDMDVDQIAAALSGAVLVATGRMEVTERPDGVTVVNDAFNANPDSVRAALRALSSMSSQGRRRIAVLGEMKELGQDSRVGHEQVGQLAAGAGLDLLVTVGTQDAQVMGTAAQGEAPGLRVVHTSDRDEAWAALHTELRGGDIVLVKGSHSVGLEALAVRLAQPDAVGQGS